MSDTHKLVPLAQALKRSHLPLTRSTVIRHIIAGNIVATRIGKRWFLTAEAIRSALVREAIHADHGVKA